jgi:hypothetical protein
LALYKISLGTDKVMFCISMTASTHSSVARVYVRSKRKMFSGVRSVAALSRLPQPPSSGIMPPRTTISLRGLPL